MLENRITALVLILVFLTQAFSRYFIVADYYLNTSEYAAQCINKDKPWMHCNGRCQLCKKLHQRESSDRQTPERRSDDSCSQPLSSPESSFVSIMPAAVTAPRHYRGEPSGKPTKMPRALFRPPGELRA